MNWLKKLLNKAKIEKSTNSVIPPMPEFDSISLAEIMYDKYLDVFTDEVIRVIYSKNKTMRYVI